MLEAGHDEQTGFRTPPPRAGIQEGAVRSARLRVLRVNSWTCALVLAAALLIAGCSVPTKRSETTARPVPAEPSPPASGGGTQDLPSKTQLSGALKDSFPDAVSYPATRLSPLQQSDLTDELYDLSGGSHLGYNDSLLNKPLRGRAERQEWFESESHVLLTKLLPGMRTLREVYTPFGGERADFVKDWVFSSGRLYRLGKLNQLLLDVGFTFDSTEMPTIAKIAVLFASFGKSFLDTGRIGWGTVPVPPHGFPAITFLSVKKGEWQHPVHKDIRRGVLVDCLVDGQRMRLFVEFVNSGRPEPQAVYSPGGGFMLLLGVIPVPKLPPLQKRGALPYDNPAWGLAVVGDSVWTEVESTGGATHHFVTVLVNADTTWDSMDFVVSGVAQP
jgi:hypothetical protein